MTNTVKRNENRGQKLPAPAAANLRWIEGPAKAAADHYPSEFFRGK